MRRIRLGGSGVGSPRKIFRKFDALRWLLRTFLGQKTSLRFTLGMVTKFASDHMHQWRFTRGIGRRSGARKPCSKHLDLIPSNPRQKCVAPALTILPLQFALYLEHLTRKTKSAVEEANHAASWVHEIAGLPELGVHPAV